MTEIIDITKKSMETKAESKIRTKSEIIADAMANVSSGLQERFVRKVKHSLSDIIQHSANWQAFDVFRFEHLCPDAFFERPASIPADQKTGWIGPLTEFGKLWRERPDVQEAHVKRKAAQMKESESKTESKEQEALEEEAKRRRLVYMPKVNVSSRAPESKTESKSSDSSCVKACEMAYASADLFDPKIYWEQLGDSATYAKEYWHAIRCYTRALRCVTMQQNKKQRFKKLPKSEAFDVGPYAKLRWKLGEAFMAVNLAGLAVDEIGFSEQYVGNYYYMCKVFEKLGWNEMLKKRRDNLLETAFISGDEAAAKHNWMFSDAVKAHLEQKASHEGKEFNVNISNIRRPGSDTAAAYPDLEIQPVIFKIVGPQSQIPLRFPEDFIPLFTRIHAKHPNITLYPSTKHRIGMWAERDFKHGEKIFSEKAVLSIAIQPDCCGVCLKRVEKKDQRICVRCNGKNCEVYCSSECRATAWNTHHRKICGANLEKLYHISRISPQDFGFYQIMMLKAIGKTVLNPDWPKVCVFDMPEFKYLWCRGGLEVDMQKFFPTYHWVARWSATFGLPNFNLDIYQSMLSMLASNCLKSTQNGQITGIVLGDAMCYMNHDCTPNSGIRVNQNLIGVYAKRDIKKGEEITYSYIPANAPKQGRKEMLHQFLETPCSCSKCV